jgi:gamma-glutamyltranspeptidase/glutathione hydrolase
VEDFYEGEIAHAIVADMRRNHGLLDAADLAAVEDPVEHEPIALRHRGCEILTIPPPGGGVELLAALELLEDMHRMGAGGRHVQIAEATYGAFALREERHGATRPRLAQSFAGATAEEPGETTHLCAADDAGNVVSLTQSIQSLFGAKVANDRYGFLYNNYLCTLPRRRHPYRLREGCPARSNAAPLLVRGPAGEPRLTAGAAGSRRIVSSLLQVVSGVLDDDLSLGESLSAPRVHARLSRRVWVERPLATKALEATLAQHGFEAEPRGKLDYRMGAVQAIRLHPDGRLEGAADPRRDGSAEGL